MRILVRATARHAQGSRNYRRRKSSDRAQRPRMAGWYNWVPGQELEFSRMGLGASSTKHLGKTALSMGCGRAVPRVIPSEPTQALT